VSAVDTLEVLVISKVLSTSELISGSEALNGDVKLDMEKREGNVGFGVVARAEVVTTGVELVPDGPGPKEVPVALSYG